MNDKNETTTLGSTIMEEREGAPVLPSDGKVTAGPVTSIQISQKDLESVVPMDISNEDVTSAILKAGASLDIHHQRTVPIVTRTSGINCAVNSPTKMDLSSSVLTSDASTLQSVSDSVALSAQSVSLAMTRKRLKLSESGEKVTSIDEITGIKKKILEHKLARLKSIRDRHYENALELYYLQSGGNMIDYQMWRKRTPASQLMSYVEVHRLEPIENLIEESPILNSQHDGALTSTPQNAEIKITGVGGTPVAVSTTLPAAVAQLSQQGSVPGRPAGGRHGMVFASHRLQSSTITPLLPGGTPLVVENNISNNASMTPITPQSTISTSQEQIVEKAKQEVSVMQRISELQKEGLWSEKRLPKVVEPPRMKTHWDYLLDEMVWLATDFAQERKWKKAAAKKCAKMVQKYFQDKELSNQKAEKAQELQLRRIASFMAKEVRQFWNNVEKLVEYRQQTRLEEKRKQALDQQLSFIVDRTEKYSQQLAEDLRNQRQSSKQNSSKASNSSAGQSDHEFRPSDIGSSDDEETIAAAEREEGADNSHKDEIEALKRESQMGFDEFLNELPPNYLENRDKINLPEDESDSESEKKDEDSEFQAEEDSSDDEVTIMEEEKMQGQHDYEKEIDELKAENEMSIEELKKKYSGLPPEETANVSEVSDNKSKKTSKAKKEDSDYECSESETEDVSSEESEADEEGLDALIKETTDKASDEHRMEDAAAIAESIQPTGNTLSSTQVVTKVPFLLKHSLREYQHIGLDWLVTMEQRRLNGILADEMGLGKTIQTIALLGHLACEKGDWGPHLIVVPTSVMLNWEMEFKKWCPGFKILTYYGTQKERKLKRIGWTKQNAFHVCITSYKLVIQDHQSFRRKKWKYLILDEAQNIKNFKSQRWQLLLNFKTQQRLLLTGTPLQNNLMELWSLMHFLMPDIFASHNEFKEWFSNPVTGMIEGNSEYNESVIRRLHKVLRPFLLRRLKSEVEKQMPKKFEHIVMCRLSKRQRFLYEDFMSRAKTKETLASGNLLSVINVLMQLRKVCNHPNLFEVRPTISPFQTEGINYQVPSLVCNVFQHDPLNDFNVSTYNLDLLQLEHMSAFESYRIRRSKVTRSQIEDIDSAPPLPPVCPKAALRIHVTLRPVMTSKSDASVPVGTSPRLQSSALVNSFNTHRIPLNRPFLRLPNLQRQLLSTTDQPVSIFQPLTSRVMKQLSHARTARAMSPFTEKSTDSTDSKTHSEYHNLSIEELLKKKRKMLLSFICDTNERRCDACPLYGCDLIEACTIKKVHWCNTIQNDIHTISSYLKMLHEILERFVIYIVSAMSPGIRVHISKGSAWRIQEERRLEHQFSDVAKPALERVHKISTHMTTKFPDPRLIQYDCGKLQTLDLILRKLKNGNHKVLIFTQMTKMLDVLEAFLNFHGHIYLRLDGTTKIEQRQILMERFNNDKRIFAFILSTRSGGVGVNLTGADTVIFYDSDWNPTMDAQAQDRCHRIGQTRDVHIYRLISEKTIEENILKKANQKRMLGEIAIEGGNFTTAYFKSSTIQDLFNVGTEEDPSKRMEVVADEVEEPVKVETEDKTVLENVLAQCEDEADVAAAHTARAEADAELAEFDESIPIEEAPTQEQPELSKAEQELEMLMQELSPIERYGIRLVEAGEAAMFAEQQANFEMEKQKREWEATRRLLEQAPTMPEPDTTNDDMLTYSREDSLDQIWISANSNEIMPVWYPPTPPQGEGDMYIDTSLSYLYDWDIMPESQLPPVYIKRNNKRPRVEIDHHSPDSCRPPKSHRREESIYAPKSLFERPSQALVKYRRDHKLHKYRNIPRPPIPMAQGVKPAPRPQIEPTTILGWTLLEDKCLLDAVKAQGLPLTLIVISPAHTPNWDLVADIVNNFSRIYRSPRQCRYRYESEILPREEGKAMLDVNQKKQKKSKSSHKSGRPMRTAHLYEQDNNVSFTKDSIAKYDTMKAVFNKKTTTPKRRYDDPNNKLVKQQQPILSEYGLNYEMPLTPMDIALKRSDRIAKEKLKSATTAGTSAAVEQVVTPTRLQVKVPPSPPLGTPPTTPSVLPSSPRPPQRIIQTESPQRPQRIVVAPQVSTAVVKVGNAMTTLPTGGKLSQVQLNYLKQQALNRSSMKVLHQAAGTQQGNIVQQINVTQQVTPNKFTPVTLASIQVSTGQQRPQITQTNAITKQAIARAVTDVEINALLKRQGLVQQKSGIQQSVTQIITSQQQLQTLQGTSGERVAVSVGTPVAVATGTANITGTVPKVAGTGVLTGVTALTAGKTPMKMAPHQIRQMQQQLAFVQRKGPKVTQLAQISGGTQVIVQAPPGHKTLPQGMTMQQIQLMRHIPQAGARVIPRQTIQVVGGSVGQVRAAGVTTGTTAHQVILSQQVSAALQARLPSPSTTPTSNATVRPTIQTQPTQDSQPKQ